MDSTILIDSIIGERSSKTEATRVLERIKKKYRQVFVPQTVLGESYLMIMRKSGIQDRDKKIKTFSDLIQSLVTNLDEWTPPLNKDILEMSLQIRDSDYGIDYCDAVLVSHAILDLDADCLFTTDSKIHRSQLVEDRVQQRCSSGKTFYITDSIP